MIAAPPKAPEESAKAYASRMLGAALDDRARHPGAAAQTIVEVRRELFELAARHAARTGRRT